MDQKNFIASWQEAHTIVDEAMAKGDRSVSIYISPFGTASTPAGTNPEATRRACGNVGSLTLYLKGRCI